LPCDGDAIRTGYRFWLPEARPGAPINSYTITVRSFVLTEPGRQPVDLTAEVNGAVQGASPISSGDFGKVVQRWLARINKVVAAAVGSDQWLTFDYRPPSGQATTGTLFADRLQCLD